MCISCGEISERFSCPPSDIPDGRIPLKRRCVQQHSAHDAQFHLDVTLNTETCELLSVYLAEVETS